MKQRIRVAAIIENGETVLLFQRSSGRLEDEASTFELPCGKINFGEQPEESIIRIVSDNTKSKIDSIKLLDVISFVNLRDSSEISNLYIIFSVTLRQDKITVNSDRYISYSWVPRGDLSRMSLDDASRSTLDIISKNLALSSLDTPHDTDSTVAEAIIYTDGGSRGNPGPSATGYNIISPDGQVIARGGEFVGITNSRQAEYLALKHGVEKALELGYKSVKFRLDNLMVVNHMNGVYQVKNRDLWPLYDSITDHLKEFSSYSFSHVDRSHNSEADAEVNKVLDQHTAESVIL